MALPEPKKPLDPLDPAAPPPDPTMPPGGVEKFMPDLSGGIVGAAQRQLAGLKDPGAGAYMSNMSAPLSGGVGPFSAQNDPDGSKALKAAAQEEYNRLHPEDAGPVDGAGAAPPRVGPPPSDTPAAQGGGESPLSRARAEERSAQQATAQAQRTTGVLQGDQQEEVGVHHRDEFVRKSAEANDFKNAEAARAARLQSQMNEADDMIDRVSKIHFDSDRIFKKPGAALMAMGAMLSDSGGKVLDETIKRDFDTQVEEANNKRQMAREKMNLVQTMRLAMKDQQAGDLAASEIMDKAAAEKLKAIVATTDNPILRAKAEEKARELEENAASKRAARLQAQADKAAAQAYAEKQATLAHEREMEKLRYKEENENLRNEVSANAKGRALVEREDQHVRDKLADKGITPTLDAAERLDAKLSAAPKGSDSDYPAVSMAMKRMADTYAKSDPKTAQILNQAVMAGLSDQQKALVQDVLSLSNRVLQSRSGQAVSEGEGMRFASEVFSGGTKKEIVHSIRNIRREFATKGNTYAGRRMFEVPEQDEDKPAERPADFKPKAE